MPSALCARAWVSSTRGVGLRQANILHCRAKPFGWKTKSCEVGFDECTRLDVGALVVDRRRYRTDGVEDGPHDDRVLERCWFERSALDALRAEARRPSFLETGGALLGWRNDTEAAVARVLEPGPRARHGLSHFEPDGEWQVSRGREIYAASGRTIA